MTRKIAWALSYFLLVVFVTGCAEKPNLQFLTAKSFSVKNRHAATVSVGIKDISQADPSALVDVHPYIAEISNAVEASGVFSRVVEPKKADYQLTVTIFRVQGPGIGLTMTANAEMGWTLVNSKTSKVVWQESIERSATKTFDDAFDGRRRAGMAAAEAIQSIIKSGVSKLSNLTLK